MQMSMTMDDTIPPQETERDEFKSSWQDKECLEALAALANTHGGTLWVGVRDNGTLAGWFGDAKDTERVSNYIVSKLQVHPLSMTVKRIQEVPILVISMMRAAAPVSLNNHYYRRVINSTREVPPEELPRFILEKTGQSWDDLPSEVSLSYISEGAVTVFRREAQERLPAESQGESTPTLLHKLHLVHPSGNLKRGAVILFTSEPQAWFLHARVQAAHFDKDEVTMSDESRLTGSLWNQLQETLDWLRKQLRVTYTFPAVGEGVAAVQRQEVWEIPRIALREALLNALLHRDYTALGAVQVRLYSDRIQIHNPGSLAERLTIADLTQQHISLPRNPLLAEVAYKMNLVEGWGTGTLRMVNECAAANLPPPEFTSNPTGFTVTLRRGMYSFEALRQRGLSERQIQVIRFVQERGAITNRDYRKMFGLSDEAARQELSGITKERLLKREGSGRSVRYIL